MIIYNAKIYTLDEKNTIYENGFIEFGEKITKIGDMKNLPGSADLENPETAINAAEKSVYPGFVDPHTHVGVWGNAEGVEGDDGNETTDPCTPHLRAIDMVNPTDYCFEEAAKAGITTVMCGPGSANPVAGQFLAMKTAGSPRIDKRILKNPKLERYNNSSCRIVKFAFGENPKMTYRERSELPTTRMATAAIIREQLFKGKRYLEAVDKHESDPENCELPEYDMKCEALLPLLRGEINVHAHCHRADDMFSAIRIAEEFSLKLVIIHGTESHLIADELRECDIPVLVGPVICDRSKPELANHTIETCGILEQKGVNFAICTDHPVVPIQYLPLSAGLAVRAGLSPEKALRAITADAAKICGIADRVGSLEIGKDADIIMFGENSVNFCNVLETPQAVFVDGKKYM